MTNAPREFNLDLQEWDLMMAQLDEDSLLQVVHREADLWGEEY